MRARLQGRLRAIGLALAVVTFASPLISTLHETSVSHVVCPDDGELIHAPFAARHAHAQAPDDGRALFPERDLPGHASGQGHEHCAVALQRHLSAREQSRRSLVVRVSSALPAPSRPGDPERPRSLVLYRLAPKASPPLS